MAGIVSLAEFEPGAMNITVRRENARGARVKPGEQSNRPKPGSMNIAGRTLEKQRGIALIVVLWLLVLLTVIAASHAHIIRTETRLAFNHVEASKARSLAEAGVYHAIMELLVRDETQRWPVNGSVHHIRFDAGIAAIAIRDARGLIDINHVQSVLLETVLASAGIDEAQRRALVDATLDWRDSDNLRHLNGAEDDDYRRAGLQWAARDGPFSCIEEFRYVLGMTNTLFERLAPYLTVYSGQAVVMSEFAPPWLASVLAGTRNTSITTGTAGRGGGSTFHISVRATSTGGSAASLDAVVRIAPASDRPYSILSWRAPSRSITAASG
jgi:general secretion pathway protein K